MARRYVGLIALTALFACSDTSDGQTIRELGVVEETSSSLKPPSISDSLFAIVGQLATRATNEENELSLQQAIESNGSTSESYQYVADRIVIDRRDFEQDGKLDAIVTIYACEAINCHSTTRSTRIALIQAESDYFTIQYYKRFDLDARISNLWAAGGIEVENTEYGANDPSCCPTKLSKTFIMFSDK
jgi:hypothetical protein